MKYRWEDLDKVANTFTVRNATLYDLRTKKPVQYYSSNTKIAVVQKCVTPIGTYYRTESAVRQGLDWAFEAQALGLPNEKAPSAPVTPTHSLQDQGNSFPQEDKNAPNNPAVTKDGESLQDKGTFLSKILSVFRKK